MIQIGFFSISFEKKTLCFKIILKKTILKEDIMITKDYLPNHPEIELYHNDTMLRINTDTFVLGEFLNIYRNDTV